MANLQGRITYGVGFHADTSGLQQAKIALEQIKTLSAQEIVFHTNGKVGFNEARQQISYLRDDIAQLELAYAKSFNSNLGGMNIEKLSQNLKALPLNEMQQRFSMLGTKGTNAFNSITSSILSAKVHVKDTNTLLNKMATTFANTVRWTIASSALQAFTGSIQEAWTYTKKLDESLNDIRIVTGKSSDEMERFARTANKAAKELGKSTTDYTNAALIYYQQGDTDAVAQAKAEVTLKAANVTGQDAQAVSEQLTAVWNGYKVDAAEAELYIDKLAAVAATTASDLEELSTGMSKVASAANVMGVDIDQLNAQIATIISVTRQAPESVGTALKTIYARMGDIQSGLDDETTLDQYTQGMADLGFNVLDSNGKLRDMGVVIEEIGGKWTTLSREQQIALSQTMAGTRQYNNLLSLFDNWDMYTDALNTSASAAGTLQEQQDIYMESLEAHLEKLGTAAEDLYDSLFDSDSAKSIIDVFTGLIETTSTWVDAIGGGGSALLTLGSIATMVFSKQIGTGITRMIGNFTLARNQAQLFTAQMETLRKNALPDGTIVDGKMTGAANTGSQYAYNKYSELKEFSGFIDQERMDRLQGLIDQGAQAQQVMTGIENERAAGGALIAKQSAILGVNKGVTAEESAKSIVAHDSDKVEGSEIYNNWENASQDFQKEIKGAAKEVNAAKAAFDETASGSEEYNDAQDRVKKALLEYKKALEKAKLLLEDGDPKSTAKIDEEIDNVNAAVLDKNGKVKAKVGQKVDVHASENTANTIADEVDKSGRNVSAHIDEYNEANIQKDNADAAFKNEVETMSIEKKTAAITQMVSSVTALTTSVSMIINIFDIWNNQDLTAGEKTLQIIMALTTALAMGIPAVLSFKTSILTLSPSMLAASGATDAASASLKQFWIALGPIGWIILGIVAVITALTVAFKALDAANETSAEKLKRTQEELASLKEQYESTKTAYEDLVSTVSDYGDGLSALRQMTKGTQEWKEQVLELNNQVLSLLEKYPQLAQYIKQGDSGALEIEKEGIDELLTAQYDAVQQTYRSQIQGQIAYNEAQKEAKINDIDFKSISYEKQGVISITIKSREELEEEGYELTDSGDYTKPNLLTDYKRTEMGIADINKYVKSGNLTAEIESYIKENGYSVFQEMLADEEALTDWSEKIVSSNYSVDNLVETLQNSSKELRENSLAVYELIQAEEQLKIEQAKSYLAQNSGLYNTINDAKLADKVAAGYADIVDDYKSNYTQNKWTISHKDNDGVTTEISKKDIVAVYERENNYQEGESSEKKHDVTTENDNAYTFVKSDGQVSEEIDYDTIQSWYINEYSMQDALSSGELENITVALNDGVILAEKMADSLALSNSESEGLVDLFTTGFQGDFDFSTATDSQMQGLKELYANNDNYFKENYKVAGYESAKAYKEAYDAEIQEWEGKSAERALNRKKAEDAEYAAAIKADAEALGIEESALETYTEMLMEANSELDKLSAEKAAKAAFSFSNGVDALSEALESNIDLLRDWKNGLTDSTKAAAAIGAVKDALEQMFGLKVSNEFVSEHLEEMQELINGNTEGLAELERAASEDYVAHLDISAGELDRDIETIRDQLEAGLDKLNGHEINTTITANDEPFIDTLNEMLANSELTTEQVNEYLAGMGYTPSFVPYEATAPKQEIISTSEIVLGGEIDEKTGAITGGRSLGNVITKTAVGGVSATMFGINGEGDTQGKQQITSMTRASNTNTRANAVNNAGKSGKKTDRSGDKIKEKKDRYHDINIELKQIETEMNRLQKAEEKLFGLDKIDNYNKQLKLIQKNIEKLNSKQSIMIGEAGELKGKLSSFGIQFNDDNTIANYAQIWQQELDRVNSVVTSNTASEEAIEAAKERWEDFKEFLERYDTIISEELPDLEDQVQELIDQQVELQIQKFELEIDVKLDLSEAMRDWNKFKREILNDMQDDDFVAIGQGIAEDFASYFTSGAIQETARGLQDVLNELAIIDAGGTSDIFGTDKTAAMDSLEKYKDQLEDDLYSLKDLIEDAEQNYLDAIDNAIEAFDKQIENYEQVGDLLDHNVKMIELLYGEDAYDAMNGYYEQIEENNNKQLDFLRQRSEYAYNMMLSAETDEEREKWEEEWKSSLNELNNLVEAAAQNIIDKYSNTIDQIFDKLEKQLTDGKGFDFINQEWELINKNADRYLDTINSAHEVQKLEEKYAKALDGTDSISQRNKLNELMQDELKMLREKDKLSQYDIDRANLKYEIALKEMALEDAKRNKSTMRMRRDSQGNYSYQFVADQDAISDAESELNDLNNELYNLDKDQYKQNLEDIQTYTQEWYDEMEELEKQHKIEKSITDEEYEARKLLINQQYEELINGVTNDNLTIRNNLMESAFLNYGNLYDLDAEHFKAMTEEEKNQLMEEMVPTWDSSAQHMIDTFTAEGGLIPMCLEAFEELEIATLDYQQSLADLETNAGINFQNIYDGISKDIDRTQDLIDKNDDLIDKYGEEITRVGEVKTAVEQLKNMYNEAYTAAKNATEQAYAYITAANEAATAAQSAKNSGANINGIGGYTNSGGEGSGNGGGSGTLSNDNGDAFSVGQSVTLKGSGHLKQKADNNSSDLLNMKGTDNFSTSVKGVNGDWVQVELSREIIKAAFLAAGLTQQEANQELNLGARDGAVPLKGWLYKTSLKGYKTGGLADYTGPAWLDGTKSQPELVLNASDTQNMLEMVSMVRDIVPMLQNMNTSVFERMNSLSSFTSNINPTQTSNELEQNVHIEANFPNVSNSREIEDAFNNLVNLASQRAYSTNK